MSLRALFHAPLHFEIGTEFQLLWFNRDMLEMWSGYGVGVVTWTVNQLKAKEYFMECLDCPIITDCVRRDSVWN